MKKTMIATVACLCFSIVCAEITDSNVGAKGIEYIEEASYVPPASDYIQDGLTAIWDAIENVDWNVHDSSFGKINDLYGGTSATITQYGQLKDAYVKCNGSGSYQTPSLTIQGRWPVASFYEIVVELPNISVPKSIGICAGRYCGLYWLQESRIGVDDYIGRSKATTPITSGFHTISVMYGEGIYIDGQLIDVEEFSWTTPSGVSDTRRIMDVEGKFLCLRKYSRKLTSEEIAYNYNIDKKRFGL